MNAVRYSPDGSIFISVGSDGKVSTWTVLCLLVCSKFTVFCHDYCLIIKIIQIFHCFEGNIPEYLSRGSWESLRCYISREAMKYLLCYIFYVKTLEKKSILNSRGKVTPVDSRDVTSYVAPTVKCPSLPRSKQCSFNLENFSGQYNVCSAWESGQYNVMQYLARLCICEVKTVQNIILDFL